MSVARLGFALWFLANMAAPSAAHDSARHVMGPADNYVYELAAPGSYRLPVIKPAPGGIVLDQTGARHEMHDLLTGHITFLAFIYTRCGDICPLATLRFAELRDLAGSVQGEKLRLITMSFDPDHDSPEAMAEFAKPWRDADEQNRTPWLFLTAPGRAAIEPLLAGFNQPLASMVDKNGEFRPVSHLMRVFLIDEKARIRNIYSPDFLDPRLMVNDLLTLEASDS
jgi:protein SCO1